LKENTFVSGERCSEQKAKYLDMFPLELMRSKHFVILVTVVQFASLANRRSSSFFVLASLFFLEEECYASANGRTVAAIRNYNTWFF
jgi:hypothetical protein